MATKSLILSRIKKVSNFVLRQKYVVCPSTKLLLNNGRRPAVIQAKMSALRVVISHFYHNS